MKLRQGFTLIELLIVVTIIAILAGAAIPYVQDYVDEARRARCKNDLDEIRNALALYELRRGVSYSTDNIASLIGPFLSKPLNDPWGAAYKVSDASSTVYSFGPDGKDSTGDEIRTEFRPRMAVSKVLWFDTNQNGLVDVGVDSLNIYVTRPLAYLTTSTINGTGLTLSAAATVLGNAGKVLIASASMASFPVPVAFVAGSDTLTIIDTNELFDGSLSATKAAKGDSLKVIAP
ncbi:MAG TPA: prepilin-type N-terminal cleavage/methylation domain-containing protein [Candidatus Ozemobacteraceae bacterium]|nr:prepilin-type N-terminal cleavage/methylation domain-containing protein [Candidatus Ozemobacteraceae bacterium]